jgi:hypothetical protein
MANVNRYISGRSSPKNIHGYVSKSGTTIEMGDLMFLDDTDGLRDGGNSTADYSCYPLSWLRPSGTTLEAKKTLVQNHFLGVAMDDKDGNSQSCEQLIAVATSGMFEFDMKPAKTLQVGYMLSPAGTTSSSNLFNQKVMHTTTATKAIGYVVKKQTHALKCEMIIRPAYSGSTVIS